MSGASRQKTVLSQASPGEKSTRKRKEKRAPHPLTHPAGLAANRAGMEPLPGWGTAWFSDLIESAQPLPGAWLGNKCKFGMESARRRWWTLGYPFPSYSEPGAGCLFWCCFLTPVVSYYFRQPLFPPPASGLPLCLGNCRTHCGKGEDCSASLRPLSHEV